MRGWIDLFVDVQYAAVQADEKCPARGKRLIFIDHSISGGDRFRGIAQQRIVDGKRLRERLVGFLIVDADRKMGDVEPAYLLATLTE